MTADGKGSGERRLGGFILSIMVPVITLALMLIIFPIVYRYASYAEELLSILYIVIRFVVSGSALFFSVKGFIITRKEQSKGQKLAVAGIVISCLQLLLCILILIGGLIYGLRIPLESPPKPTAFG